MRLERKTPHHSSQPQINQTVQTFIDSTQVFRCAKGQCDVRTLFQRHLKAIFAPDILTVLWFLKRKGNPSEKQCAEQFFSQTRNRRSANRKVFYPKRAQLSWITGKKMKGKTPVHYSYRHVSHGGGTQLRGHIWPVVIRAFVASKAFVAIVCFLGQIIKYALRIILGFGSNGLWDWNQINFTYALLSRSQLCRNYALFEGHFWPKFVDGGALKHFNGPVVELFKLNP